MTTEADRLFNCCTAGAEPVWSQYTALRIGGCIDHNGETEGGVAYDRAQFFTVYGVAEEPDGEGDFLLMVEAITDVPTVSLINALTVANELAERSGLRLTVCAFLFQ